MSTKSNIKKMLSKTSRQSHSEYTSSISSGSQAKSTSLKNEVDSPGRMTRKQTKELKTSI